LFTPPAVGVDTVSIPGAQGGANWGTTAVNPSNGAFYVLGITVPSIYRLSLDPPGSGGPGRGRSAGPSAPGAAASAGNVDEGRAIYQLRCMSCHGPDLRGNGTFPSLIDASARIGPETLRDIITGGRLAMPPTPLSAGDMASLLTFLASPNPSAAATDEPAEGESANRGPVVASGGAPGARAGGYVARGGMVGPEYPEGLPVPSVRYYTDYGMQANLVKPPYSTLTAYDLNTGTIKWQIPAGGDDPRAVAEGASNTGYPRLRTGIITTSTGLLFQAGLDGRLQAYA